MVDALQRGDRLGLFGPPRERQHIVIHVEVMPPDSTNTERARTLNREAALTAWLREAAEP